MDEYDDIDETSSEETHELFLINGESPAGASLLKIFIAAAIIDNNGTLEISQRAIKEFRDMCKGADTFELWAEPSEGYESLNVTIKWRE